MTVALTTLGAGCAWPQWGGGPEHRGSNFVPGLSTSSVQGWVADKVADLPASSSVVDANGLAFEEQDGRLSALDRATGAVVWAATLPAGSTAGGAPAVNSDGAASTVFVTVAGASNPVLLGFDVDGIRNCNPVLDTCSPVFVGQLGSTPGPATPVLVEGGKVFARGATALAAFDAKGQTNCSTALGIATCTPLWSATTGTSTAGIGPTKTGNGLVFQPAEVGAGFGLRAFDEVTGATAWTGTLGATAATATPSIGIDGTVFVPAGSTIRAFALNGCGSATCNPVFSLAKAASDPAGTFMGTPAFDGTVVYATNTNGRVLGWPASGCGAASCTPTMDVVANAPPGGSSGYHQAPVIGGGVMFLLAQRSVAGANHMVLLALAETDGHEVARWDFGTRGFGAGIANPSVTSGMVYAPVADALFSVHAKPVQPLASLSSSPLALSPAFSPSIFDYVVRCAAGSNSLTFTMSAIAGGTVNLAAPTTTSTSASQTVTVPLNENQAAVVQATDPQGAGAQYWIRCLPADFPAITYTPHPAAGSPTPGWYVLANGPYAIILDRNGTPVWYKHTDFGATNVTPNARNTVAFMPNPVVAFGIDPNGRFDSYSLATNTVQSIHTVGTPTDLHELQTPPNGNHLMLSYPLKTGVDLTGLAATPTPGPNSTMTDCVVQNVDPQGNLVWQWKASDYFDPVTESTTAPSYTIGNQTVYDPFHCNSIDPNPAAGTYLVSARNMSAVFEIRQSDGKVLWKLGGTPTNKSGAPIIQIQNDPDGGPAQQHDARYLPNGHISMFDNQITAPARGVEYSLDVNAKTAQLVYSYSQPESLPSCCMGDFRLEPDGHRIIGWGYVVFSDGRTMTELDAAGHDVLDIGLPPGTFSYRVIKVPPPFYNVGFLRSTAGT